MTTKYDEAYEITVMMAKVKMSMNKHKGDIENKDPKLVIEMAKIELDELAVAIERGDYINIIEEVADVLNFSIAASYMAIKAYKEKRNVKN